MGEESSKGPHHEPQRATQLGDDREEDGLLPEGQRRDEVDVDSIMGEGPVAEILARQGSPKGHHDEYDDDPHPPPIPRRDNTDAAAAPTFYGSLAIKCMKADDDEDDAMASYFLHLPQARYHQGGDEDEKFEKDGLQRGDSEAGISTLTGDVPFEPEQSRRWSNAEEPPVNADSANITHSFSISQDPEQISKYGVSQFAFQLAGNDKVFRRFLAISILLMLLLATLVVCAIFKFKDDETNIHLTEDASSSTPSFSNSTAPTNPPENPPTSSPLPSSMAPFPTESTISDLYGLIVQLIRDIIPSSVQALLDQTSPQYQALQWLIEDLQERPIVSNTKILQRLSMAIVFFGMNGDSWTNGEGWLSSDDICQWFSTSTDPTCNDEGLMQRLELQSNNLVGYIPDEIRLLSESLLVLNLSQNRLVGEIPEKLGELTNLSLVKLESNDLAGTIPSVMCEQPVDAVVALFVDCSEVACSCCEGC